MTTRITWVTCDPVFRTADGKADSNVASIRYRVLIPSIQLELKGCRSQVVMVVPGQITKETVLALQTDIVVFSKSYSDVNEHLLQLARQFGARTIVDICDNHFEASKYSGHFRRMAAAADLVTCNTPLMAACIAEHTGKSARVIGDPYEGPAGTPVFAPGEPLRLVWFGHPANYYALEMLIPALIAFSGQTALQLSIVTLGMDPILERMQHWAKQDTKRLSIAFHPWSRQQQWEQIAAADLVILPSQPHEHKTVKSPNRLVESLRAGRMAVAHPLPSYLDFKDWAWVGEDLLEGIRWCLEHRAEIPARIKAAQPYIEAHYAPELIGKQWQRALEQVLQQKRAAS